MLDTLHFALAEWRPRTGVGPSKFLAEVAARTRRSPGVSVVPTDVAGFLAPHPVDLLPASEELLGDLHRLGWHRLGDVAAQQVTDLLDRFGREGRRAWEFANGIDERPLTSICRPSARGFPVAMKGQDTQEMGIWPCTFGPLVACVDTEAVDTVAEVRRTLTSMRSQLDE